MSDPQQQRTDWLAGGGTGSSPASKPDEPVQAGGDLFNSFGTISTSRQERAAQAAAKKEDEPKFHRREINTRLINEDAGITSSPSTSTPSQKVPGGPGSQWRMTKLRRVYEAAASEGRDVTDVARERYDTLAEFEECKEERRILDARSERRDSRGGARGERSSGSSTPRGGGEAGGGGRYMFTSDAAALNSSTSSRPGSRAGFRRPGEEGEGPRTPGGEGMAKGTMAKAAAAGDHLRRTSSFQSLASGPPTPIPSVLPPTISRPAQNDIAPSLADEGKPVLSASELNKLQAAVLKAKLMDKPNAAQLEADYEKELQRSRTGGSFGGGGSSAGGQDKGKGREEPAKVEMVPTVDARGRLYDVGLGAKDEVLPPGVKRKRPEKVETHDKKTGEVIRREGDDGDVSLSELVRQERFGAGAADQKNMDRELAKAIANDGRFREDNDYMDENADKLARKKIKTDASKRLFAINDYARTKKALDSCQFCPKDEDGPPRAAIIAMGTRAYLACTQTEELVEGHCLIVPMQHSLSTLEGDDDVWDEIKNFMKTLMKMFAEQDKGVLFWETVVSFKQQRHTYIEAVPVPWDLWDDAPAYFREGILSSESEWSQHKKLIDFSARPGGFRRSLVSNLPYFMVQWDYKGEKGFGHVIEGVDDSGGRAGDADDQGAVDEGDKGGGKFPAYFGAEIVGSVLDLEPRKWRKPKRVDSRQNQQRVDSFLKSYAKHDWTGQLGRKK